jgi:hypothetical protein
MGDLEKMAADVVNKLLEKIPMNRLRKISLQWKEIGGFYLPVLDCEFLDTSDIPMGDIPKEDLTCAGCFERGSCPYDTYNADRHCYK